MSTVNICPHCGFKSHDDEICNACGKMIHDDVVQKSFRQVVREIGTDLKKMGFHGSTPYDPLGDCSNCGDNGTFGDLCPSCGEPI